jgi:hypothetical protein
MDLKEKIVALAEKVGYENANSKINMYSTRDGDLHSNASVDGR